VRIGQRLYLTVAPAILGVFLMAALAYWGEYTRRAPGVVLFGGALAVLASLVLTWLNARYVTRRIERLAAGATAPRAVGATSQGAMGATSQRAMGVTTTGDGPHPADEIEEIERTVNRLSSAVELAEASQVDRERLFEQRARDYARLLASVAEAAAHRLEEVRLPLHILLENHFGELNENQEEMLGAARTAAEAADSDMVSLRQIAELDLGTRPLRKDRIKPSELIEAMRPMLLAAAESAGVTLELDIAPLLPAVIADRARLQEALVTLLRGAIESASRESRLRLQADRNGRTIRFVLSGGGVAPMSVRWAAAARVVQAHAGSVDRGADGLVIELSSGATDRMEPSVEYGA
jgi:signal transduction histidine kinase